MAQTGRRKKNKSRNLLLLILLAVSCMGAYVLVHHLVAEKEASEESQEEAAEKLLQVTTDDVVELTYEYGKQNIVLVKENDTWKLSRDKKYPVDQEIVSSMLAVFNNTSATKTIADNQDETSEYGMDEPLLTATVVMKDKSKTTVTVGMAGIGDSSEDYYVAVSGKDGIYMTSSGVYAPFQYDEKQLGEIEDTPSISSDSIYKITVNKGSKTTFEAKKDLESESVNYDNWTITAPYASEVAGDTTNLSSLASTYTSYSFTQNVDYDQENDAKYGLDNPAYTVKIKYTEEEESDEEAEASPSATATSAPVKTVKKDFTLYIGSKDSAGNYYVRTSATKYVYLMSAEDVNSYVAIDAFSEVSTTVFDESLSDVKTIVAKTASDKVTYTVDTEKEDEDLTSLYEAITALTYKGEADSKAKIGDVVLTLTLTYGEDGQYTKNFEFTEQDSNYDQVTEDGKTYFVVDKREVETILGKIK